MNAPGNTDPDSARGSSLDDHIHLYNYDQMLEDAQNEFDSSLSSRELIDQRSIARIFRMDPEANDERN